MGKLLTPRFAPAALSSEKVILSMMIKSKNDEIMIIINLNNIFVYVLIMVKIRTKVPNLVIKKALID